MSDDKNSVAGIALIIALLALILSVMNFVGINPAIFRIETNRELEITNQVAKEVMNKKLEVIKKAAKRKAATTQERKNDKVDQKVEKTDRKDSTKEEESSK